MTAGAPRRALVAAILGSGIVFLDQTVVNVALPAMRADLDLRLVEQLWVVEAYLLTLGALLLVGGSLGDILGRRRIFTAGLIGFGLTSLACGLAPTAETLIAARAVQGVAGALLVPSSLALITSTFPLGERAAAIGSWTAWTTLSFILGPFGGGLLVDHVSWRWIFLVNPPFVVLAVWLLRSVPESGRAGGRLDGVGALLAALGLAGTVFALIEQPRLGWGDASVLGPLIIGLALLAAFVWWEARVRAPMLPLGLFRARNFAVGNVATLLVYGGLGAMSFFLTLYLQQVAGYSALAAGLAFIPTTAVMWLTARRFGALAERIGPRWLMGGGPIVAAAGLAWIARIDPEVAYLTDLFPGILVFAVGLSATVAPLTATVLAAAPEEAAGIASGANNAIARVASLVAIAAVGAVVSAVYVGELPAGASRALEERPLSAGSAEVEDASTIAHRAGLGTAALLMAAGGLVSLAGISNARRPLRE